MMGWSSFSDFHGLWLSCQFCLQGGCWSSAWLTTYFKVILFDFFFYLGLSKKGSFLFELHFFRCGLILIEPLRWSRVVKYKTFSTLSFQSLPFIMWLISLLFLSSASSPHLFSLIANLYPFSSLHLNYFSMPKAALLPNNCMMTSKSHLFFPQQVQI